MTAAAPAPCLSGLHHPRSVAAGHAERHPLRLAVLHTLTLAATAQCGTHRRRLALGAHVDALGHGRRPELVGTRLGAHPARRPHVGQRVHRTVAAHTDTQPAGNATPTQFGTIYGKVVTLAASIGKHNVAVWRPSRPSVCLSRRHTLTVTHQWQHATRPVYISTR